MLSLAEFHELDVGIHQKITVMESLILFANLFGLSLIIEYQYGYLVLGICAWSK